MKMTSAYANKLLRSLKDEKDSLITRERSDSHYIVVGEETVKEDYDFATTRTKIGNIDATVMKLRHAINLFNCTSEVMPGMTLDMALVRMAQLSADINILSDMKDSPEVRMNSGYGERVPTKIVSNYSISDAKDAFKKRKSELGLIQMAVDKTNLIGEFEVDIEASEDIFAQ